jgi:hypothetical protein
VLGGLWAIGFVSAVIKGSDPSTASSSGINSPAFQRRLAETTCQNLIKRNLKNPASFRHVSTESFGTYITVVYRGTNSYGGVVTNKTNCEYSGDIVRITS